MGVHKGYFWVVMLIILSVSSFAYVDYNNTGRDGTYALGGGIFNADITGVTTSTQALSNPKNMPLVSDLNNDGVEEIIAIGGNAIKVYHSKNLDINSTLTITNSSSSTVLYSNMITFDIDGDGQREIILAEEGTTNPNRVIYILNYSNSNGLQMQKILNINSGYSGGELELQCRGINDCIIIGAETSASQFNTNAMDLLAFFFSSTSSAVSTLTLDSFNGAGSSNRNGLFCFPTIRNIALTDDNNDGIKDYVVSYALVTELAGDNKQAVVKIINSTNVSSGFSVLHTSTITSSNFGASGAFDCQNSGGIPYGDFLTSPTVFNFDANEPFDEIMIGIMTSPTTFYIQEFDYLLNNIDTFPESQTGDGVLISNVFRGNYFGNSNSKNDVCVVGQDANGMIDLLCGNHIDNHFLQTREYIASTPFNLSHSYRNWNSIAHSVQEDRELTGLIDYNEMLDSHGVWKINDDCNINGDCTMSNPLVNTGGTGVLISANVENVGLNPTDENTRTEDLILMTSTNIYYFDDGLSNNPAVISKFETAPCYKSIWKLNTSVSIFLTVTDTNSEAFGLDTVSGTAILYYGTSNEQRFDSTNVTSGTQIPFSFIANQTTPSGIIRVIGRDSTGMTEEDTKDYPFVVQNNGVEFGDNSCVEDYTTTSSTTSNNSVQNSTTAQALAINQNDNFVTNGISALNVYLKVGGLAIWLIIMIIIDIFLVYQHSQTNSVIQKVSMGTLGFIIAGIDFLFILVGAVLSILSWGIVLMIVIVSLGISVVYFSNKFTSGGG